jgi:hypothetical protein
MRRTVNRWVSSCLRLLSWAFFAIMLLASACSLLLEPAPSDGDTDADSDSDTDGDGDIDGDSDSDIDGDGDSDTDADGDSDGDGDGDADGDADTDGDSDGDDDADADGDADGDTDGDGDSDGDGDDCVETCPLGTVCDDELGCVIRYCVTQTGRECGEETDSTFDSIEEAVESAVEDVMTVVYVVEGEYTENETAVDGEDLRVSIRGEGGDVRWASGSDRALKISNNAFVEVWGLSISAGKRAIEIDDATAVLRQVTLHDCSENGIKAVSNSRIWIYRSLITRNTKAGIHLEDDSNTYMVNSFIVRNGLTADGTSGSNWGGVYLKDDGCGFTAINTTIADNRPERQAGAISNQASGTVTLTNVLMWDNTYLSETQCQNCGDLAVSGVIEGAGEGCFSLSLRDREGSEDYQIFNLSVARDAGIRGVDVPDRDYWNDSRDDRPDVGADEYVVP